VDVRLRVLSTSICNLESTIEKFPRCTYTHSELTLPACCVRLRVLGRGSRTAHASGHDCHRDRQAYPYRDCIASRSTRAKRLCAAPPASFRTGRNLARFVGPQALRSDPHHPQSAVISSAYLAASARAEADRPPRFVPSSPTLLSLATGLTR